MATDKILVEQVGDVGVIRLNDPDTLNAVTPEMLEQLDAAFDTCSTSSRAIVLTSVGRAFSSGANLTGRKPTVDETGQIDAGALLETHVNPMVQKLTKLPIPWISAVRGPVTGVACSIALAADMIVASETAFFLQAFSRIGLVPDGGSTWLLTRAIGRARAMELMLLGDKLPAGKALEWGLINRVAADDAMDDVAFELAKALAQGPTKTYGLIRNLSWIAADENLEATLAAERIAQRDAGRTKDAMEGIMSFAQKRTPNFTGS